MNRSGRLRRNAALGGALACVLLATGCAREEPAVTALPVPSVKTVQVQAQAAGSQRTLSGMLMVAEETRLSFAIGGKLLDVPLREGDEFKAGQELARLDPLDFERELASSKARLVAAAGQRREAQENFRRQQTLEARGTVSRAALERAEAALASARSDQHVAEVVVAGAEENLRRTRLLAPRDGIVTKRVARQFEEIPAGQPVYEVGSRDALEVLVLVPEHLVAELHHGAPVTISLPGLQDRVVRGSIASIGATAEAGNAFSVKARLDEAPPGARSGMSASVQLALGGADGDAPVYAVPLSALAFERTESGPVVGAQATLFVFDEASSTVRRRELPVVGMAGNRVFVSEGLSPGERVVTAGVAFLRDGQQARLWAPPE